MKDEEHLNSAVQFHVTTESSNQKLLSMNNSDFLQGDIVIVMEDLNAMVGSDYSLPRHVLRKHSFEHCNDNTERFTVFCNSFEQKAWHNVNLS